MRHFFLALLQDGPAHGYDLKRSYDRLFGAVAPPLNVGQVYVTMRRLEREGLVTVEAEARDGGRDVKTYAITTEGGKVLEEWLAEPVAPPSGRSDLVVKLAATWLLGPDAVRSFVAHHRQLHLEQLRRLDARAAQAARGSLDDVLVQGAALRIQAELRFLDLIDERAVLSPLSPTDKGTDR